MTGRIREDPAYLTSQLITYLGNKRALLPQIDRQIRLARQALGGRRLVCADVFSGSGAVARLLKQHAALLYVNDLETYSRVINECYLTNREDYPAAECARWRQTLE
ncbi:MAG: DNA adenine methylase, partial [Clostridia bacterium]|nr:DNA adenine methylase [Clostridia bacterium]